MTQPVRPVQLVRGTRANTLTDQMTAHLRGEIENGTYPVGGFLPTQGRLSSIYGVSYTVVGIALTNLATEGIIQRAQGHQATVIRQPMRRTPQIDKDRLFVLAAIDEMLEGVEYMAERLERLKLRYSGGAAQTGAAGQPEQKGT